MNPRSTDRVSRETDGRTNLNLTFLGRLARPGAVSAAARRVVRAPVAALEANNELASDCGPPLTSDGGGGKGAISASIPNAAYSWSANKSPFKPGVSTTELGCGVGGALPPAEDDEVRSIASDLRTGLPTPRCDCALVSESLCITNPRTLGSDLQEVKRRQRRHARALLRGILSFVPSVTLTAYYTRHGLVESKLCFCNTVEPWLVLQSLPQSPP